MATDGVGEVERLTEPLPEGLARPQPGNVIELPENTLRRMAVALERLAAAVERWVDGADAVEEPGTPLPADFPGKEALEEQGVLSLESVPRKGSELAALGLEPKVINRVITWMRGEI